MTNCRSLRVAVLYVLATLSSTFAFAQIDARMFRQPSVSRDRSPSSTPATSGSCRRRAARPFASARRPARRRSRASRRTARRSPTAPTTTATSTCTSVPSQRRRADAPDASPDGRSRDRLASRRQARAVRVGARERTAALQPVLSRRRSTADCPRSCRCRTASSAPSRRTATQFVYMPMSQDFRNWKRYRGGWAPDLMLFDLKTFATKNITSNPANDAQPMWHGNTIYFLSDRGANQRNNIWADDLSDGQRPPGHAVRRLRHHVPVDRS